MSFTVRRISPSEYMEARKLWDICFPEDASGYSEYYFAKRTRPEYVVAVFDGDTMVGDLHAVPYPLMFGGVKKKCAMVGGVATLPEFRHRGIASMAIRFAHEELAAHGYAAALLKPDVDFYAQYGYVPFAYHDEYTLDARYAGIYAPSLLHAPCAGEMLHIYNAFAKDYCGMMARTEKDMELYLEEAALASRAACDGQSYALYSVSSDGADIYELAGNRPEGLLAALTKEYNSVSFRLPAGMELCGAKPSSRMMFSMLCPLDESALLSGTGASCVKELLSGVKGTCCTLEFC